MSGQKNIVLQIADYFHKYYIFKRQMEGQIRSSRNLMIHLTTLVYILQMVSWIKSFAYRHITHLQLA